MTYIDNLIKNCESAKAAVPQREFVLNDLDELNDIQKAIYIIEELNGNSEQTFLAFSKYKESKARACARLNAPSATMYVGSSTTGVKSRIKQHLGDGPKGTYALHLSEWFKGEYRITILVYEEPIEVIQIIEDALSHKHNPAFGKRGGNNK